MAALFLKVSLTSGFAIKSKNLFLYLISVSFKLPILFITLDLSIVLIWFNNIVDSFLSPESAENI